jgi:DHA1 family tetracycline resistance protein-like MFS transporter
VAKPCHSRALFAQRIEPWLPELPKPCRFAKLGGMSDTSTPPRQLGTLFLITFINLVGFGVVLPIFPFFGTMVEASPGQITLALGAYSLGQFIGAPLWGKLSDRYGRRPILVASLLGAVVSYLIMAHAQDIVTLGASRLLGGLMAGNIAAAFAYVGDITSHEQRPKAMGIIGAAFGLGFIFGPAIGGLLAGNNPDPSDFVTVGYASAGITAVAALAAFLLLPESLTAERRAEVKQSHGNPKVGEVLRAKPVVWALMALTLLVIGSAAMMETTLAFFAHDEFGWGPSDVGLSFGAVGLISALLQGGAAGPLARRFGSGALAVAGVLFHAIGLALLALASSGLAMMGALAVMSVGLGLFNPAFQTLTSEQTSDGDRGLVMGLTQGASSLGRVVGPAVSGTIYSGIGHRAPFAIGALVMALAIGVALLVARASRPTPADHHHA